MRRTPHWWNGRRRGAAGVVLVAVLCLAWSAQAAIHAIIARADAPASAARGYEAQDHFPGAASYYAADDAALALARANAAPGAGSTGTAVLPDLPIPASAASLPADGTVRPAQPFSMRLASPLDRARALDCLATAIYYEAASEPDAGQRAVAQVILNRVRHPAFPATVCGVVYQGSEHAGCQFSYACDGAMARRPDPAQFRRALAVAADALGGRVFAPAGLATHYHTYAVTPAWNRQLVMTAAIGAHFFHRWQGWWGTPAAFYQQYRGGEPAPGPHAPPNVGLPNTGPDLSGSTVVLASAQDFARPATPSPAVNATASRPTTQTTAIQPGYADSGQLQTRYATVPAATAPGDDGQILDRWKDSGKPLR